MAQSVQNGNLSRFDLGSGPGQPLSHLPKGAYAWSPSISHDRKRLAYAYFVAPTNPNDQGQSDLARLTHVLEGTPIPTWSPTGAWLAVAGSYGLYLVEASGRQAIKISPIVSGGGIAWTG